MQGDEGTHHPGAVEVGLFLRRALELFRTYKQGHAQVKQAVERLLEGLTRVLEAGPLQLEVSNEALMLDDQPLLQLTQGRRDDGLAPALFVEGVRRLTFEPGLTVDELSEFLTVWFSAAVSPKTSEGITTRLWERELKAIRLVVIDTFEASGEGGDGTGVGASGGDGARVGLRQQLDGLIASISAEGLASSGDVAEVSAALLRVGADDIALLRAEGLRDITADSLAQQDVSHRQVEDAPVKELEALAAALSSVRTDARDHFLDVLVNASVLAPVAQRELLALLWDRTVRGFAEELHFADAVRAFQRLVGHVREDTTLQPVRTEVLVRFRASLLGAPLLDPMLAALDTPDGSPAAEEALKMMGKAAAASLSAALGRMTTPIGKRRVSKLIAQLNPETQAALVSQMKTLDAEAVAGVLAQLKQLKPDQAKAAVLQALSSTDPHIRKLGADHLDATLAMSLGKQLLHGRLGDNDSHVRVAMMRVIRKIEDPTAVPVLASLLHRKSVDAHERIVIYDTLAALGGFKALVPLLEELHGQADPELKSAVASALGQFDEPDAKHALEELGAKLVMNAKVKAACRTALRAIEERARGRA